MNPAQSVGYPVDMSVDSDALLLLALGHLEVDHGNFDPHSWVGQEFVLRVGNSPFLQDHFADCNQIS